MSGSIAKEFAVIFLLYEGLNQKTYTGLNFIFFLYVFVFRAYHLLPILACSCNNVVITSSYVIMYDPSFPLKICERYGWSSTLFYMCDFVFHTLPALLTNYYMFYVKKDVAVSSSSYDHCGFYSLLLSLLWGLSNRGFVNLTNLYVPYSSQEWNSFWSISIAAQLLTMATIHALT